MVQAVVTAALLLVTLHAGAQSTVYRCVSGGKVSYGSVPCVGGTTLAAPAAGQLDPAALASATGTLQRQKALLEQRERERQQQLAQEQREQKRAAADRRQCDKLRLQQKWRDEDAVRASASARTKLQRQARRSAEALALSCPG